MKELIKRIEALKERGVTIVISEESALISNPPSCYNAAADPIHPSKIKMTIYKNESKELITKWTDNYEAQIARYDNFHNESDAYISLKSAFPQDYKSVHKEENNSVPVEMPKKEAVSPAGFWCNILNKITRGVNK